MLNKIPCAIALFTSTQGHFKVKTRYLETIESLDKQIPLSLFSTKIAHVKVSPGEDDILAEISSNLHKYGFRTLYDTAYWSHGDNHGEEYIKDMIKMYNNVDILSSSYVLHLEDDWKFSVRDRDLSYWLYEAMQILTYFPEKIQVRFARFADEIDRINDLKEKHGIDACASGLYEGQWFTHNDFSLNPSIFRPRDLFVGLQLLKKNPNVFPMHPEHGLGRALKYVFGDEFPFACLNPEKIKVQHIGTPIGQEDHNGDIFSK